MIIYVGTDGLWLCKDMIDKKARTLIDKEMTKNIVYLNKCSSLGDMQKKLGGQYITLNDPQAIGERQEEYEDVSGMGGSRLADID